MTAETMIVRLMAMMSSRVDRSRMGHRVPRRIHTATLGRLTAEGKTPREAVDNLGGLIAALVTRDDSEHVAMWWDHNSRSLWVATPDDREGSRSVVVHFDGDGRPYLSPMSSWNATPVGEAHEHSEGMTKVTHQRMAAP